MLRLSKLADYATTVMCQFARFGQRSLSAADIAEQTQFPVPTVRKLLKQLSEAKLLASSRGAGGGYTLNSAPEEISLLAIVSAIDGPSAATNCCLPIKQCLHQSQCTMQRNWQVIDSVIRRLLQTIHLTQMAQGVSVNDLLKELDGVKAN